MSKDRIKYLGILSVALVGSSLILWIKDLFIAGMLQFPLGIENWKSIAYLLFSFPINFLILKASCDYTTYRYFNRRTKIKTKTQ